MLLSLLLWTNYSGQIPSFQVYADETTHHKQDRFKREQNLLAASSEIIRRMNGEQWCGASVIAIPGCTENIFSCDDIQKMTTFFDKYTKAGREVSAIDQSKDWQIRPCGWVYEALRHELAIKRLRVSPA